MCGLLSVGMVVLGPYGAEFVASSGSCVITELFVLLTYCWFLCDNRTFCVVDVLSCRYGLGCMWLGAVGVVCMWVIRCGLFWSFESSDEVLGGLKPGASWQHVCPRVGFFRSLHCFAAWFGWGWAC